MQFSTFLSLGSPRIPFLPVPHQPEPAPALLTILLVFQAYYSPIYCLSCSPPAASSYFWLFLFWSPPEVPCCPCLTSLSPHQHWELFSSILQALSVAHLLPVLLPFFLLAQAITTFFSLTPPSGMWFFRYLLCLFTPFVQHLASGIAAGCAHVSRLH